MNDSRDKSDRHQFFLRKLKQWLDTQAHLNARGDDQWLFKFLQGCNFDLDVTCVKFDNFYTIRMLVPEFFRDRDPTAPELQYLLENGVFLPLLTATPTLLFRNGSYDPWKTSIFHVLKLNFMTIEYMMDKMGVTENNLSMVLDMRDTNLGHWTQFTPGIAKKTMRTFMACYPLRVKSVHIINAPTGFEIILNLLKYFAGEDLRKVMLVHTDYEELFKFTQREFFPTEYGGQGPMLRVIVDNHKREMQSYKQWFADDDLYYSDEGLRVGQKKTLDDIFNGQ